MASNTAARPAAYTALSSLSCPAELSRLRARSARSRPGMDESRSGSGWDAPTSPTMAQLAASVSAFLASSVHTTQHFLASA